MEIPISKKDGCRRKALKETSWLHGVNQIWQILTKHCVWCATKDSPAVILAKGAKHIVLQKSKKGQKILVSAVHRLPLKLPIHLWHSEMKIYKTEILWMIKMCVEDCLFSSSDGISDIFRTMFPGQIFP